MFELISYKIVHEGNKIILMADVANNSNEEKKVELLLVDLIFGLFDKKQVVTFKPWTIHWISWVLHNNDDKTEDDCPEVSPLWGSDLKLFTNNELNCTFNLKYSISNLDLRLGLKKISPFNKKKFWIIGDSHTGYYTNTNQKSYLQTKNYDIVPSSIKSLSLYNFLNSNWRKYLDYLPIFDDDIIAFDFGEIDLRCGLLMTSTKKNITPETLLSNLLFQYTEFILEMKRSFKNEIVIICPNRPVNDGFLEGNLEYYKLHISNFSQRKNLWDTFNHELERFCENNNIKYWDIKKMYTDKNGGIMNDVLIENDIHIKIKEPMLFELKNRISNTF